MGEEVEKVQCPHHCWVATQLVHKCDTCSGNNFILEKNRCFKESSSPKLPRKMKKATRKL
jgi:hypothetical protein